jgi:hypothetical protein
LANKREFDGIFRLNPHLAEICGPCDFEFFNRIGQKPSFDDPIGSAAGSTAAP